MNFSFNETAGLQSGPKKLKANTIHKVTFDGVELVNDVAFKNGNKGNVLDIKFSNSDGEFVHRIFELTSNDMEDRDNQFGGKNPSNFKNTMAVLKHLIDAVNPELGEKIDKKEEAIGANSWDGLRKFMVEATKDFVGTNTEIKLIVNKDGFGIFPFAVAYTKEGKLYMPSKFIGNDVTFTPNEIKKISTASTATPTPVSNDFHQNTPAPGSTGDLDFNL